MEQLRLELEPIWDVGSMAEAYPAMPQRQPQRSFFTYSFAGTSDFACVCVCVSTAGFSIGTVLH